MRASLKLALCAVSGAIASLPFAEAYAQAPNCEALVGRKIAGGLVLSADRLPAGSKRPLPAALAAIPTAPLAANVCRVKARLSPARGSEINVEVWLPTPWNGKFVGTGGGGFSGGIDIMGISAPPLIARGYAAAGTDVGHPTGDSAKWAYKQPAKLVDYGHRGNHLTAVFSKALMGRYYGRPVDQAYFQGCSNGGRDALMEASRYPKDYDGIIVGAPAAAWVQLMTHFAWTARMLDGPPAVSLTPAKLRLVNDAVLAGCDGLDGVKDGVLENPRACRFDPAEVECKSAAAAGCLSANEVKAVRAIYQGLRDRDGRQISHGFTVGTEAVEWANWITNANASQRQMAPEFFRWMVYGDETWSLDRFDRDRDFAAASSRVRRILNSDNPDLRPFMRRGGKLILYHGWADAALPAENTIAYFEALNRQTPQAADQARLFMVPGMAHCGQGTGTSQFDMLGVLDRWVETGQAPEQVLGEKPENPIAAFTGMPSRSLRSRPLCAWPKVARWKGVGSTDDAASFNCVLPDVSVTAVAQPAARR